MIYVYSKHDVIGKLQQTKYKLNNWQNLINEAAYSHTSKKYLSSLVKGLEKIDKDKRFFLARHYLQTGKRRVDADIAQELGMEKKEYSSTRKAIEKELHPHVNYYDQQANFREYVVRFKNEVHSLNERIKFRKLFHSTSGIEWFNYEIRGDFKYLLSHIRYLDALTEWLEIDFDAKAVARETIKEYDELFSAIDYENKELERGI